MRPTAATAAVVVCRTAGLAVLIALLAYGWERCWQLDVGADGPPLDAHLAQVAALPAPGFTPAATATGVEGREHSVALARLLG